ncbi:MAG: ABC transporter substrate-binding protein [Mesorhizobium sp.]|uniref:ABC transporter substrate-binding protein n=1 Tax=Mesorhizobium sp. TaxID=1871066 RepID=UPI000FE72FDC|nr:ABC transporter substrate-binding protein [Mesorhizobium sp.]RWI31415.1 MAG: ABC transporter substrate-binding protein [Mesorhizobium sp.]TIO54350.1 MAG: ABC transporter substrate-binding protein [Mesorhizobium sp.]TIO59432.1 MAG: ABC transporter substrate-binding protein [Mesorhizobium sp.]TJV63913.1 MAG: ABC transporter substrate-binding protein [Mesorhizobium sp.]
MIDEMAFLSERVAKGKLSRREFLGRAAALGVSAVLANNLLAKAARAEGPVKGGLLKAGVEGGAATDSLDPAAIGSAVPFIFSRQWGEQLVQLDADKELQPALAEEWGASKDAKVWTFKIRKAVQFHNGKEMTPADVLATMQRNSDANSKSGALGIMQGIDKIAVDGQNVVFTLKEANVDFPFLMDDYHLLIQPNGGKDNPTEGIGTGPYKVTVNDAGVRLGGERFAGYWRDDRGFADQIEIIVSNDATARTSALQSGQVHMINRVDPKVAELIKRLPSITIRNVSGRGNYNFACRCDTAPFDNNDLRLALKYAIDREEMVQKILGGYGSVGNDTPINNTYPLFTELEQRRYDPDKAAFHYKKSGHSGSVLLHTSDVGFPGAVEAAQLYQQSAAKAGITIEVKREPGDGYWSEVWGKQPFFADYTGGRPTQDLIYSLLYYSKAEWNGTRFVNEKFDQMLVQARGELDADKRKKLYSDMGQILRDEGGAIIPMFNDFIDATGPQVGGWVADGNQELMGGYALSKCWLQT